MTTVKELIKQLETMPQDLEVCYYDYEHGFYGVTKPTIVKVDTALDKSGNEVYKNTPKENIIDCVCLTPFDDSTLEQNLI